MSNRVSLLLKLDAYTISWFTQTNIIQFHLKCRTMLGNGRYPASSGELSYYQIIVMNGTTSETDRTWTPLKERAEGDSE